MHKRSLWPPILSLAVVAAAVVGGVTVNQSASATPAPAPVVSELEEDDPGFDCRFDGNKQCGVFLMGEWRVINYDESGKAVSVHPRGA